MDNREELIEKLKSLARSWGWVEVLGQYHHGNICPGCHNEIIAYSRMIWMSPKGMLYHDLCFARRIWREHPKSFIKEEWERIIFGG